MYLHHVLIQAELPPGLDPDLLLLLLLVQGDVLDQMPVEAGLATKLKVVVLADTEAEAEAQMREALEERGATVIACIAEAMERDPTPGEVARAQDDAARYLTENLQWWPHWDRQVSQKVGVVPCENPVPYLTDQIVRASVGFSYVDRKNALNKKGAAT